MPAMALKTADVAASDTTSSSWAVERRGHPDASGGGAGYGTSAGGADDSLRSSWHERSWHHGGWQSRRPQDPMYRGNSGNNDSWQSQDWRDDRGKSAVHRDTLQKQAVWNGGKSSLASDIADPVQDREVPCQQDSWQRVHPSYASSNVTGDDQSWGSTDDNELADPKYIDAHNLVLEPTDVHVHSFTIIALHSCSGGPDDFIPFFHHLDLPFRDKIRVVVPCSPKRREAHFGWENVMNSWFEYDDESKDGNAVKHSSQLLEQRDRLVCLADRERRQLGGDGRRLILFGLSQGAGLAVDVALHASFRVGGVVALRGMALAESLQGLPASPNDAPALEVLAINGERDRLCPPENAGPSYDALRPHGVSVCFQVEPRMAHSCARGRQKLNRSELRKVSCFLRKLWDGM
eukprot:TRINITY_DN57586_c0_g1_i1.p1 TRINITY_DN57586_c0_g1~~TRINITY_DN57586_c0_g1_i1.p1  ORF type:complete len:440 (-),score=52.07 TRINITY_DN57586_c0_g1_i1:55-1269(-)